MKRLTKIKVLPLAYTLSLIYLVVGVLAVILYYVQTYIASFYPVLPNSNMAQMMASLPGYWAILIFPVSAFISGFISGIVVALIYNFVARYTGGIELEFAKGKFKKK